MITRTAALLVLLVPALAAGQTATDPFTGEWVGNISKSRLSPAMPLESVTLRIAVTGDTMTDGAMRDGTVSMSATALVAGKELRDAETLRVDGSEKPGTLNPGIMLAAKFVGTHVLVIVAMKGGSVIRLVTHEVSADGKTLTSRTSGAVEQVIVYERR
jgi:hypothetical protein